MLKKVLYGGLLGGLTYFVWLGLSWSLPLLHLGQLKGLPQDEQTDAWLAGSQLDHSKLYYYPAMRPQESEAEYSDRVERQPVIGLLNVIPAGEYRISPLIFVRGLAGILLAGLLLAWLLLPAAGLSYWRRVGMCSAFGLACFCAEPFLAGNFLFLPRGHMAFQFLDLTLGWSLAGLVIAAFVKPESTPRQAAETANLGDSNVV